MCVSHWMGSKRKLWFRALAAGEHEEIHEHFPLWGGKGQWNEGLLRLPSQFWAVGCPVLEEGLFSSRGGTLLPLVLSCCEENHLL